MNSTPELENTVGKNTPKRESGTTNTSGLSEKLLAIGEQRVHVNAVTTKIRDDIAFLEDRIFRMEKMQNPSETVLNTYRTMLDSRQSVLQWLEEHEIVSSPSPAEKTA